MEIKIKYQIAKITTTHVANSKLEYRNPKQIRMSECQMTETLEPEAQRAAGRSLAFLEDCPEDIHQFGSLLDQRLLDLLRLKIFVHIY
jgi:hypothetical protein